MVSRAARHLSLVLLLVCFGSGCSAVSERVAGWYVTRKLDSYLDLTSAQKTAARSNVDQTLLLLRRTELPHWVSFLREVRQGFHDGMSDDGLLRLQRHYDARLDAGVDLLTPRFAPLLVQLDTKQLDHFAARMREDVDKLYEGLDRPEPERRAEVEKRALKFVSDFVGDLSDEQEQAVRLLIRKVPDERALQYRVALDNIASFRAFMAERPDQSRIEGRLHSMWDGRYDALGRGRDKDTRRAQQRRWLLDVFSLLTPKQRAHAEAELTDRIVMMKKWVITS